MTSSRGVGGAEELIAALVDGGRSRGWQQTVLNPFADDASIALAERMAVPYEAHPCANLLGLPRLRAWLSGRIADLEPDILHVMLFHATVLTAGVRRGGERRLLTHVYGDGLSQLPHSRIRVVLDRWAGRRFDHVSAISDAVSSFLVQSHRYPPPPVARIRLGWSGDPHPRKPSSHRPPTIVCVAALRREKGHQMLLAAFAEVLRELPAARLVLVGDGPHRPVVEAAISEGGLAGSVELTGRVDQVWPYLADADVFALVSPREALGIAIMEAMAAGLPVVATDVGGIPELVTPGVTGELVSVDDHLDLARKLTGLLTAPQRLAAMSAAAVAAADGMRMQRSIDEYFDLYARLLDESRPPTTSRPGHHRRGAPKVRRVSRARSRG